MSINTLRIVIIFIAIHAKCNCFKIFSTVIGETSYDAINEEYKSQGHYQIVYRKSELFQQNFNESVVNKTQEVLNFCLLHRPDRIAFPICLCSKLNCVEFYCDSYQVLDEFRCRNVTENFEKVAGIFENSSTLFFSVDHRVFGKVKSTSRLDLIGLESHEPTEEIFEVPVVTVMETNQSNAYFELMKIDFNCQRKVDGNAISKQERHSYVIHSISLISLLILIVFFTCLPETRVNAIGKSWIMYTSISFANYLMTIGLFIYRDGTTNLNQMIYVVRWVAIVYSFTEFSVYFWLNVISFDAFRVLRSQLPLQTSSNNFKKYLLICTIMPLIISVVFFMNLDEDLMASIVAQRRYPHSTFGFNTKLYMASVGLTEMLVKTVTLIFFLGAFIVIKRQEKELKKMDMNVSSTKQSLCERIIFGIRMGILLGMVVGSLACNYIIYFMSVFNTGSKFCDWNMMWVEELNPLFETLKRLTGLYVLIYVFTGRQYLRMLKNKLSSKELKSSTTTQTSSKRL